MSDKLQFVDWEGQHCDKLKFVGPLEFDNGCFSEIGLHRLFDSMSSSMQQIRIEIKGKDEFWSRAFHVEWEHQFPDRALVVRDAGQFIAEGEWFDDLERVASQTFCRIVRAPENPQRRRWINSLIPRRTGS